MERERRRRRRRRRRRSSYQKEEKEEDVDAEVLVAGTHDKRPESQSKQVRLAQSIIYEVQ